MYSFLISIHALPNITCRSSASKFTNFLLFHGLFHLFSLFTFFNLNLLLLNVVVVCHFCLVKKRRHVMCFFNVISQLTYPEEFSFIWYFPPISIILFSSNNIRQRKKWNHKTVHVWCINLNNKVEPTERHDATHPPKQNKKQAKRTYDSPTRGIIWSGSILYLSKLCFSPFVCNLR
jgi:hypothetical protein